MELLHFPLINGRHQVPLVANGIEVQRLLCSFTKKNRPTTSVGSGDEITRCIWVNCTLLTLNSHHWAEELSFGLRLPLMCFGHSQLSQNYHAIAVFASSFTNATYCYGLFKDNTLRRVGARRGWVHARRWGSSVISQLVRWLNPCL